MSLILLRHFRNNILIKQKYVVAEISAIFLHTERNNASRKVENNDASNLRTFFLKRLFKTENFARRANSARPQLRYHNH